MTNRYYLQILSLLVSMCTIGFLCARNLLPPNRQSPYDAIIAPELSAKQLDQTNKATLESHFDEVRSTVQNEKGSKTSRKFKCILKRLCCKSPISIRQKDVGPEGYTIKVPGYYCLKENIVFNPAKDAIPAITIASNNVVLDMNGKVLSQSPDSFNSFKNTSGIVVNSGFNYISIINGVVTSFVNHGILVESAHSLVTDHVGIIMKDLTVTSCGKITTDPVLAPNNARAGIGVYGATDVSLENCDAAGITALTEPEAFSIYFVENLNLDQCKGRRSIASDVAKPNSQPIGFSINNVNTYWLNKCMGSDCTAAGVSNQTLPMGFSFDSCNNGILNNCIAQGNNGVGADGFLFTSCTAVLINNCQGNFTQGTAQAVGIGFISCKDIILENSLASNNSVIQPASCPACASLIPTAAGIAMLSCTSMLIRNCMGSDNSLQMARYIGQSRVAGMFVETACSAIWFDNCTACNNITPSPKGNCRCRHRSRLFY